MAELIRGIRRNPHGMLDPKEELDPVHVAYLIRRPRIDHESTDAPRWLTLLRSLFCGLYTVDNMDFVLRDSYMAGYSTRAFDLDRLLHYSFFTEQGLTIHAKGLSALVRFIQVRAELFRVLYFHRVVRAFDMALAEVFRPTLEILFPGNPLEHLDAYQKLTEWSLLVDVARWAQGPDSSHRELGEVWQRLLRREMLWKMACEKSVHFQPGQAESASIFSAPELVEKRIRAQLPAELRDLELRVDVARHYHRPGKIGRASCRERV